MCNINFNRNYIHLWLIIVKKKIYLWLSMCAEAFVPKLDQGSVATAGHIIYMCGWVGVGVVWDLGGD
jgi:hypothetical protein